MFVIDKRRLEVCSNGNWSASVVHVLYSNHCRYSGNLNGCTSHFWVRWSRQNHRNIPRQIKPWLFPSLANKSCGFHAKTAQGLSVRCSVTSDWSRSALHNFYLRHCLVIVINTRRTEIISFVPYIAEWQSLWFRVCPKRKTWIVDIVSLLWSHKDDGWILDLNDS